MLVAAVLAFAAGLYLCATLTIPLYVPASILLFCLLAAPFLTRKAAPVTVLILLLAFSCAGFLRLETILMGNHGATLPETKDLFEGMVIEASPRTKVLELTSPDRFRDLKVVFRTADDLTISDRVRLFGEVREMKLTFNNPGITSWKWLKRLEGVSYEIRGTVLSVAPGTNLIQRWRKFLGERIDASGAAWSAVIKALTIGDTASIDEATKTLFSRTGTSHILAISGSNIGIVAGFFFFLARLAVRRLSMPLRLRGDDTRYASLVSIPFVLFFMVTAGASIPTIRATIMIVVLMIALFFERKRHLLNTLASSALIILLIYPHSIFMPTFQLTFASVVFLILFTKQFYPFIKKTGLLVRWTLSSILMTVAATLGTLPVVLHHFYGFNPYCVLHNLIAVPLMCAVAMPMSLTGLILPAGGDYLLRVVGEILGITITILTRLDFGYLFPVIRPSLFEILLYFALLAALLHLKTKAVRILMVFCLIPVTLLYGYRAYDERFGERLTVHILDVGMGDSTLVEGPKGVRILIDGGGFHRGDYDVGKSVLTPILLMRKIRTIDWVVNTHPHGDHIGGLGYVVENFRVRAAATGRYFVQDGKFLSFLGRLREKNIPLGIWQRGETITFPGGLAFHVLSPGRDEAIDDPNNASLVLRLLYRDVTILLTGDIGSDVERNLVRLGPTVRAQVLKIPHHGSRNSNDPYFIRAVAPRLAVLSAGPGVRGLPSEEALATYRRLAIPVLRTDRHGAVTVTTDGTTVRYRTVRDGPEGGFAP